MIGWQEDAPKTGEPSVKLSLTLPEENDKAEDTVKFIAVNKTCHNSIIKRAMVY